MATIDPTMVAVMTVLPVSNELATLATVHHFIQDTRRSKIQPEVTAVRYLKIFKKETQFTASSKEIQKFLPNVNLKNEKRLAALFGVTPANVTDNKNPKEVLYNFVPHQYILATMVNSMTFDQFEKRIDFAFKMYDHDDDGKISKSDLKEMLSMYGKEGQFRIDEKTIGELVDAIVREIDESQDGLIELSEFKSFFDGFKSKNVKFDIFEKRKATQTYAAKETVEDIPESENRMIAGVQDTQPNQLNQPNQPEPVKAAPVEKKPSTTSTNGKLYSSIKSKLLIDGPQYIWIILWLAGLIYFFTAKFIKYYNHTGHVAFGFAKGFAGTLAYNIGIMIALITKSLTTILRKIGLVKLLPLNFNVEFHAVLGFVTMAGAWGHSLAHLTTTTKVLSEFPSVESLNAVLKTPVDEVHTHSWWVTKSIPGITGLIALSLMSLMVVLAVKRSRQKHYERFWYTHALWIVVIPVLCVHGMGKYIAAQEFYWWVGFPTIVLIIEKLYTLVIYIRGKFQVVNLEYLESGVVELLVQKPSFFKYIPGQYARINIPELSKLQWHPFSFSSSPDQQNISFHISPVGDWTNQLKQLADDLKSKKILKSPTVYLEGPYGAPSQHYSDFKHVMIVSSGVGATPFASIMRGLNHKLKQDKTKIEDSSVDFYWVNRKPSGHVWLTSLFRDLKEDATSKDLIRINMYFTSANAKYDIRSLLLWRGMEILHKEGKKIKGLDHFEMMHWGRPEWDQIFRQKAKDIGQGEVGVFFCGNNFLAEELYKNCIKHSGGDVVFKFYKEIF